MTKSKGALALGLVIVVVAALLAIFNQSRTFAQFMGPDYDPGKLDNIQIFLSAIDNDTPSRGPCSPWGPCSPRGPRGPGGPGGPGVAGPSEPPDL